MDYFNYREGELHAEDVPVKAIAALYGTPCYIYSRATLERHWHACNDALGEHPHMICYAVKANSNIAVLNLFARLGSGFDVVSVGELERVLAAGGDADKIVFSGVAKKPDEIRRAIEAGIYCFNVESEQELLTINQIAEEMHMQAPVTLRVNPDVDAKSHPYISTGLKENKFGIDSSKVLRLYQDMSQLPNITIKGIGCHIGSQITELEPFLDALDRLLVLVDELAEQGITIEHLDLGGGLGVRYQDEEPPHPRDQAAALKDRLAGRDITLLLEPGRAIAANAGILVSKVIYLKTNGEKNFAIVDAAMNDLLRPALYQAWQNIIPVVAPQNGEPLIYDVVGPVCETGDFLGKDRALAVQPDDLLAVRSAGAYGFSMSSNYNSRPRCPEIMVDGLQVHLIRPAESIQELFEKENLLP